MIDALIEQLPAPGEPFPAEDRVVWLKMMAVALQVEYGKDDPIDIKKRDSAS